MGYRLHARTMQVNKAGCEFDGWTLDWIERHGLTYGEIVSIMSGRLQQLAKYMIRTERHGDDSDKRGDEA